MIPTTDVYRDALGDLAEVLFETGDIVIYKWLDSELRPVSADRAWFHTTFKLHEAGVTA